MTKLKKNILEKDEFLYKALIYSLEVLLKRQVYNDKKIHTTIPAFKEKKLEIALKKSIGLGGGFTLDIGNYWLFNYTPSFNFTLNKSEDGKLIEVKIKKSTALKIAKELFDEFNKKPVQLNLF